MTTPLSLMFGPWVPDVADNPVPVSQSVMEVPIADCSNVYFSNGQYKSIPTPVTQGAGIPAQVLGTVTVLDQEGKPHVYAGTQTHLYHWSGTAWTDVSGSGLFFAASWSFAQFGSNIIAAFSPPQVQTLESFWFGSVGTRFLTMPIGGSGFSSPTASPSGSCVGVVNQFALVGNVWIPNPGGFTVMGAGNGVTTTFTTTLANTVPLAPFYVYAGSFPTGAGTLIAAVDNGSGAFSTTGMSGTVNYITGVVSVTFTTAPPTGFNVQVYALQAFPYRVQWSAIGDQTQWPVPLTNAAIAAQSSYEDLTAEFGGIQYIAGFPQFGILLQRFGITRCTYVGGSVVFTFAPYEKKHGVVNGTAAVPVGSTVYYVSDEGFYATDGNSAWSIGTAADQSVGIDQWYRSNVNKVALSTISAAYDSVTRCVFFAIPTGSNTLPDTLLIYNAPMQRWTKAAIPVEMLWSDNANGEPQLGIINQAHTYATLTGTPVSGYLETCDVTFADGYKRATTGVRPVISCSDIPTARVGTRDAQDDDVSYTRDTVRDQFTRVCPLYAEAHFTRVRISSKNASSITGAVLMQERVGMF